MYMDPVTFESCGNADPRVFTRIEVPLIMLRNVWLTEGVERRMQINSAAVAPAQRGCYIGMDVVLCDEHRPGTPTVSADEHRQEDARRADDWNEFERSILRASRSAR